MSTGAGPAPATSGMVVFTDLDGTLLDYDGYRWGAAAAAVEALRSRGIPIVFCSSKTRAEQRHHQAEMELTGPLIVENGSAVVMSPHETVALGLDRSAVLDALGEIRRDEGLSFRGYADMTVEEVAALTGLAVTPARLARLREFSETVRVAGGQVAWERFMDALEARGLRTWGRGPTGTVVGAAADKGRAVRVVAEAYRRHGPVTTVGLGDGANDEPMLAAVDRPFLVERPGGGWTDMAVEGLERVDGVGPVGWARAAERILQERTGS